jgi:hypothetical protein
MKILKKGGVVEKRGEEETKSMPHAPVIFSRKHVSTNECRKNFKVVAFVGLSDRRTIGLSDYRSDPVHAYVYNHYVNRQHMLIYNN